MKRLISNAGIHLYRCFRVWQTQVLPKYCMPADECQLNNYSLNSADDIVNNSQKKVTRADILETHA